ncbi:hypothetical protein [Anabaena sp. CA = ATCC 33047]|nr:hypothetical protein [Anabaena sp. CA = ATCC 33047]
MVGIEYESEGVANSSDLILYQYGTEVWQHICAMIKDSRWAIALKSD